MRMLDRRRNQSEPIFQLFGPSHQPWVRRPELKAANKGGGEEVRIDPANAAAVQPPIAHKVYDVAMRHDRCLVHSLAR